MIDFILFTGLVYLIIEIISDDNTFCGVVIPSHILKQALNIVKNQNSSYYKIDFNKGGYLEYFKEKLIKNGLHTDMRFLLVVESGLNPNAKGESGELGIAQFMETTAMASNPKLIYWDIKGNKIDVRNNAELSIQASANYLKDLYIKYNNYLRALLAYNKGYSNAKNVWNESNINYIIKIIAVKLIYEAKTGKK